MSDASVVTPEPPPAPAGAQPLASRADRVCATIVDGILMCCVMVPLLFALDSPHTVALGAAILFVALWTLYYPVSMWLLGGQTPAKRWFKIWVAGPGDRPCGVWRSLLRDVIVRQVIGFVFVLDPLFLLLRSDRRSLHDLICGTRVYRR
jgi:uncharacterized RDD family membrane protein YckC